MTVTQAIRTLADTGRFKVTGDPINCAHAILRRAEAMARNHGQRIDAAADAAGAQHVRRVWIEQLEAELDWHLGTIRCGASEWLAKMGFT